MRKEKISIALATYNGEHYLAEQLESFASQTRLPDQLVVCDDCSNDNTISILESFAASAHFPINIYINRNNLGTGRNFARALNLCTGDIIAFSDQDDVWLPHKLEKIEQTFIHNPNISYVISDAIIVDDNLQPLGYTIWEHRKFSRYWQNQFERGNELDVFLRLTITTGMVTAIRDHIRHFCDPLDFINHDSWYIPLAAVFDHHGALIKEPLVKHRQHSTQQYGASKLPFKRRLKRAFKNNLKSINRDIKLLESLLSYIDNSKHDTQLINLLISKLNEKCNHLHTRSIINNNNRYSRLPKIFREIKRKRYFKYGSWKNIIIDILS